MIDLFFIKTFISVVETGSFRIAAQKNNITQPAVSQHIRILEQTLKCQLLERSAKRVALTSAGEIFLHYARQILELYQNAQSKIQEAHKQYSGVIRIASIYSMGLYQLKPMMQHFLKKYPGISIHLEYRHNNVIYDMVRNGAVDFGLVAFPKTAPGITAKTFAEDLLVLTQLRRKPFLKMKQIRPEYLNQVKFIRLDPKTPTGHTIQQFLKSNDIKPHFVKEYDNIETIKNAVEVGLGCSILPKTTILKELKDKKFSTVRVREMDLKRPLGIICRHKKIFTPSTRIFYEMIGTSLGKMSK